MIEASPMAESYVAFGQHQQLSSSSKSEGCRGLTALTAATCCILFALTAVMALPPTAGLQLKAMHADAPSPVSHHDGHCIDGGTNTTIHIRFPPSSTKRDFSWPPLPPAGAGGYSFALDQAIIVLSPSCVVRSRLAPNAANGEPGSVPSLWLGRLNEVNKLDLGACGCGVAIFCCGSGGCTGDNVRNMLALASQGYSVVAPDSMASPSASYPRARPCATNISRDQHRYWCKDDLYAGGCKGADAGGTRPACFSSDPSAIAHDPAAWAAFYERVFVMRSRELDHVLTQWSGRLGGAPSRLILAGMSEGGMVAARYSHPQLAALNLAARFISEYACEYTYFISCADHALLGAPSVPTLNLLSAIDPFFGSGASPGIEHASDEPMPQMSLCCR